MSYESRVAKLSKQYKRSTGQTAFRAILGNAEGATDVPGKADRYYIRKQEASGFGAPQEVKRACVLQTLPGTSVWVDYDYSGELTIVAVDTDGVISSGGNPIIHNPASPSISNGVAQQQIVTFTSNAMSTAEAPSMEVNVRAWIYLKDGVINEFMGERVDLTSYVPAAGLHCFATLFLKTDNTIEVVASTAKDISDPLTATGDIQECVDGRSADAIPCWAWRLYGGQTSVQQTDQNHDCRGLLNITDSTGGGGAPTDATYITQTPNGDLTNEQALSALATGLMVSTTGTGVVSTVAAPTGAVVGTTDSQTLTNKTLAAPTIADFTNAQHDHLDADDGGTLSAAAIASGQLALARGGTNADLSATGGANYIVKQSSSGGALSSGLLTVAEIPTLTMSKISNGAWVFLDEDVLGSAAASMTIDLSAVAADYEHFELTVHGRSDRAATLDDLLLRINGTTSTSAYAGTGAAFNSGAAYQEIVAGTAGITGIPLYLALTGSTAVSNTYGDVRIFFFYHQLTGSGSGYKQVDYTGWISGATTASSSGHLNGGGRYNDTLNPITTITLLPRVGSNLEAGTRYTINGWKVT